MRSLVIFAMRRDLYGLDLGYIQRIIELPELTNIPGGHPYIDGLMSYEGKVIKVLGLRKLVGLMSYEDELKELFTRLEEEHKQWIEELASSVVQGQPFEKTTDPHACELGDWLDTFNSYDDDISRVLQTLYANHSDLHRWAITLMDVRERDEEEAMRLLQTDVMGMFDRTMDSLHALIERSGRVADSLQRLLVYQDGDKLFGIKVDSIADIVTIDEKDIHPMDDIDLGSDHLRMEGAIEFDGKLVNVIRSVRLPQNEEI